MSKNFDQFFDEYKKIHKKYSDELSMSSWPLPEKITFGVATALFACAILTFLFIRGNWFIYLIGSINVVCSGLLIFLLVKYGTKYSKREVDLERISELDSKIKDYVKEYNDHETLQLLIEYANSRISRRSPFALIAEAIHKTGAVSVLVITFFAGAQSGEMHTIDCLVYTFISVTSLLVLYLIIAVCKEILEPLIYPEKYICVDLIDDLKDLKLFNSSK